MDGGITRQSEQYGIFEDRPRPDRIAREAPLEVIADYTRGRSVGVGMLNPRGIRRQHFAAWRHPAEEGEEDSDYEEWRWGEEQGHHLEPPPYDEDEEPGLHPHFRGDRPHPFGTPTYNPRSSPYDDYPGSRLGFNRQAQDLMTHMFMPGSQVGLPYQGRIIPGIVHQLHPDSEVGVRWNDGQYTKESPGDIYPL